MKDGIGGVEGYSRDRLRCNVLLMESGLRYDSGQARSVRSRVWWSSRTVRVGCVWCGDVGMTEPAFTKEDLVSVYAALVEVSQSEDGQGIEVVAEVAEMDVQSAELAMDELEHMGFVEHRDGSWSPNLLLNNEE